jgi:hypothetical protein
MIANVAVKEASGVCRSLLHPGVYYVHNDSGSKPILYAIDSAGRNLASTIVPASQTTVDAEDCGSAVVNGRPMLVLCDVGDNACRRASYKMIVMEEPRMLLPVTKLVPRHVVQWMYPDGRRRNCEACALLPSGVMLVVTKSFPAKSGGTTLFTIRSPLSGDARVSVSAGRPLPSQYGIVTGMDVMGDKIVLLGMYRGQGIATVLDAATYKRLGAVKVQAAQQREGICYSHDGASLLVVSEVDRKLSVTPLPAHLRALPGVMLTSEGAPAHETLVHDSRTATLLGAAAAVAVVVAAGAPVSDDDLPGSECSGDDNADDAADDLAAADAAYDGVGTGKGLVDTEVEMDTAAIEGGEHASSPTMHL